MKDFFEDLSKEPQLSIFERVLLWWKYDGKCLHKKVKWGVQNLIYWFPIIWRDRNWDGHYIYEILKHKLKSQSNYISINNRHTKAQQDSRRMNLCVSLIQKLQEDFYEMEYMDYEKTNHWFEDVLNKPGYSTWESKVIWENYDEYFKKYPLVYKRVMNGGGWAPIEGREDDKHFIAMSMGMLNMQRAQNLLFRVINDNINSWWD